MRKNPLFNIFFSEDRRRIFSLIFCVSTLLHIAFHILRNARSALTVADSGGSASLIPYFDLLGGLPINILLIWLMVRIGRRFSSRKVFLITLNIFTLFFLFFAFAVHPYLQGQKHWLFQVGSMMAFYVATEMWKVSLMSVLFWGYLNQQLSYEEGKTYYAPLALANSVGSILAGYATSLATSDLLYNLFPLAQDPWGHSLCIIALLIAFLALSIALIDGVMRKSLDLRNKSAADAMASSKLTIRESLKTCYRSQSLTFMAVIVLTDYMTYCLGEVIFLDVLHQYAPDPRHFCQLLGQLGLWSGWLMMLSSLWITPWMLDRFGWKSVALVTPLSVLITQVLFLLTIIMLEAYQVDFWLKAAVYVGCFQYCICRTTKYAFLDVSKELAFIPLSNQEKVQGKLIIDGIASRFARGTSSTLSLSLIAWAGLRGSAPVAMGIAIAMAVAWLAATNTLGKKMDSSLSPAAGCDLAGIKSL